MTLNRAVFLGALIVALTACATDAAVTPGMIGRYDFRYHIDVDDTKVVPQIFDDGERTYIQLRGVAEPTVLDKTNGEPVTLPAKREGQNWVVQGLHQHLVVIVDRQQVDADYTGEKVRGEVQVAGLATPVDAGDNVTSTADDEGQAHPRAVPKSLESGDSAKATPSKTTTASASSAAASISQEAAVNALLASGAIDSGQAATLRADIALKAAEARARQAEADAAEQARQARVAADAVTELRRRRPAPQAATLPTDGQVDKVAAVSVRGYQARPSADDGAAAPRPQKWVLKREYRTLRRAVEAWVKQDGRYEVIWTTRDFPLDLQNDLPITDGDLFQALSILGESYRHSEAPFQVAPNEFGQLVFEPMGLANHVAKQGS